MGWIGLLISWALAILGLGSLMQADAAVVTGYRSVLAGGDPGAIVQATVGHERLWALVVIVAAPLLAFVAGRSGRAGALAASGVAPVARGAAADDGLPEGSTVDPHGVALRLLATLQEEARLLDFVAEDVPSYSDQEVGAAARGVHAGLVRALRDRVEFEPLRTEQEGAVVAVEDGYAPAAVRLLGSPVGQPPWKGSLVHPGWVAKRVELAQPIAGSDPRILAPAEIEVDAG